MHTETNNPTSAQINEPPLDQVNKPLADSNISKDRKKGSDKSGKDPSDSYLVDMDEILNTPFKHKDYFPSDNLFDRMIE